MLIVYVCMYIHIVTTDCIQCAIVSLLLTDHDVSVLYILVGWPQDYASSNQNHQNTSFYVTPTNNESVILLNVGVVNHEIKKILKEKVFTSFLALCKSFVWEATTTTPT